MVAGRFQEKLLYAYVVSYVLFTQGKDHGVHPFVVQIRDNKNHQPLPGCTIGDIGNKMGYNAVDNGSCVSITLVYRRWTALDL